MSTADRPYMLEMTATPDALDAVHALLHNFWHGVAAIGEADRMRFDLAVAEVAANIIEHCQPPATMVLVLKDYDDRVVADFDENGELLPGDVVDAATSPEDDFAESGRGLVLAREALDEFVYERQGEINHWHLVRRRHD